MVGPEVSLENPQPLMNGVHEVREAETQTVQTNEAPVEGPVEGPVEARVEASVEAIETNGIHTDPSSETIETNGVHTDPSTETLATNGFHASPLSSEPETNGIHPRSTIQTNGVHHEPIQTNGVHDPFDVDAHTAAISQEVPVVNGIHPLKAAKLEAAATHAMTNGVQLEPEHVATTTGINKTRSDSGVGMTNETTAH